MSTQKTPGPWRAAWRGMGGWRWLWLALLLLWLGFLPAEFSK
ncbi:hypothetical protein [Stenotrophomonas sp. TWI587]|jgi:hypothetical protein